MKKYLSKTLLLLAVLIVCVSCVMNEDREVQEAASDLVQVKFIPKVVESKGLTVSDLPDFDCLSYQATKVGKPDSSTISGEVSGDNWEKITKDAQDSSFSTKAVFTQGYWEFKVKVGDGTDNFYEGTAKEYLSGDSTTVTVELTPIFDDQTTGSFKINITTPQLSSENGSFKITIFNSDGSTKASDVKDGDSTLDFSSEPYSVAATTSDNVASIDKTLTLKPGIYIMHIQYASGSASTETAVIGFKVIGKTTSSLTGSLDNGGFVKTKFDVSHFSGTVTENNKVYTFVPNKEYPEGSVSCTWYLNGVADPANTKADGSYEFKTTSPGAYCLTCVAVYTVSSTVKDVESVSNTIVVK